MISFANPNPVKLNLELNLINLSVLDIRLDILNTGLVQFNIVKKAIKETGLFQLAN